MVLFKTIIMIIRYISLLICLIANLSVLSCESPLGFHFFGFDWLFGIFLPLHLLTDFLTFLFEVLHGHLSILNEVALLLLLLELLVFITLFLVQIRYVDIMSLNHFRCFPIFQAVDSLPGIDGIGVVLIGIWWC